MRCENGCYILKFLMTQIPDRGGSGGAELAVYCVDCVMISLLINE